MEYRYPKDKTLDVWGILDDQITRSIFPRTGHVHFYPSESSVEITDPVTNGTKVEGRCMRASYFRFTNQIISKGEDPDGDPWAESDNSAQQEWKFEISRHAELMLTESAKRAGIYMGNSVAFLIHDINVKGELDIVVIDPWTEDLVGLEVKSIYGYHGEKEVFGSTRDRKLGKKGKPKISHVLQTALYTWHWRDTIKYFKILYFSRGNAQRAEFTIKIEQFDNNGREDFHILIDNVIQEYTINSILDRIKRLESYIETQTLPPREFDLQYSDAYIQAMHLAGELGKTDTAAYEKAIKKGKSPLLKKGDWMCSYCSYASNCYDKSKHPIADNVIAEFEILYSDDSLIEHNSSNDLYKYIEYLNNTYMDEEQITIYKNGVEIFKGEVKDFLKQPRLFEPARKVFEIPKGDKGDS